ncbi:MAG: pilus assembly protein, partial [Firmicutes bacterium]|nr:pilus assembly protein [Bacillota bacterium]
MKPAAGLFSRTEEGSFTVEMALIFPTILLLIVAVVEIGMLYRIRIMTDTG